MSRILLFNKPWGVVSQFTSQSHEQTLADYISLPGFYAAGRLDKHSEGLLILTNNGRIQHQLSHPNYHKKKYYYVQVEGIPTDNDLMPLRKGLTAGQSHFLPAGARCINEPDLWPRTPPIRIRQSIPTSWLEIILSEGKNHQIRKMTAAIGFPTLRLVRVQIANWQLNGLKPGEYRLQTLTLF